MKEHPFQGWVEKTAKYSGVLACGVRLANQATAIKSFDEAFPETRLKELLQSLAEVAFTLRNSQISSARLRWVFENGQLHTARHADGAIALLIMNNESNPEVIEELFADFLATISPLPENAGYWLPPSTDPSPNSGADGLP